METIAEPVTMNFTSRPSALYTLWKGFWSGGKKFVNNTKLPALGISWQDIEIDRQHLAAFNEVCDSGSGDDCNLLYPYTWIYACNLRILSHKSIPLSIFKMLNVGSKTTLYRRIGTDDVLNLHCAISDQRFVSRGLEVDLTSRIESENDLVWENTNTFYFRGYSGDNDSNYKPVKFDSLPESYEEKQWFLPARNGFRFARIMGDSNGIHYSPWYARMMGFKRDFAQPVMVLAKCIDLLTQERENASVKLDVLFKGPLYYGKNITLKSGGVGRNTRFDVYCQGNDRPCIKGTLYSLK